MKKSLLLVMLLVLPILGFAESTGDNLFIVKDRFTINFGGSVMPFATQFNSDISYFGGGFNVELGSLVLAKKASTNSILVGATDTRFGFSFAKGDYQESSIYPMTYYIGTT